MTDIAPLTPTKAASTVALLRCSTKEQDTQHQREAIVRWAAQREEDEPRFYEEAGVSGASKKRPVLDEIVRDAVRGRVKLLIVYELERLGRTMPRIVATIDTLGEAGCGVVDVRRGLDTRAGMGKAMIYIAGVFAEIERNSLRERTISALAGGVDDQGRRISVRGKRLGRRPNVWTEESDERLARLVAAGHPLRTIVKSGEVCVQSPMVDAATGEWTWKWVAAGRNAIQARIKAKGLRKPRKGD